MIKMSYASSITTMNDAPRHWLIASLAVCMLTAILWSAPVYSAVTDQSQDYFDEAQSYLNKGDTAAATIQLKNAIKADPNNVEARMSLAKLHLKAGDGPSAEKEVRASLSRGYDTSKAMSPLGQALLMQGKWDAILSEIDPKDADEVDRAFLYTVRADSHIVLGDIDAAQKEIDNALALNPTTPEPYISQGYLSYQRDEFVAAESALTKALELGPDHFLANYRMGETLARLGRYKDSLTYFDKAIEVNINEPRSRIARANIHIILKNDDLAERDAQAILERNPNNSLAQYLQAVILGRKGQSKVALDTLLSANNIESYTPALYLFASLYYANGQSETAATYLDRFLAEVPENSSGRMLQAKLALDKNDTKSAIKLLEELNEEQSDNYQITLNLANAYLQANRFNDAAILFDEASALDPRNDQVKLLLAQSQISGGDFMTAIPVLEDIIQQSDANPQAYTMLIVGYIREKEHDKARDLIEKLKQVMPGSGLPYNFLAAIELSDGNSDAARGYLEQASEVQEDFYPALLNLARLDLAENDKDGAKAYYQRILDFEPGHIQTLTALINFATEEEDYDEAMRLVNQAQVENPDSPQPQISRIQVLVARDEMEKALTEGRVLIDKFPADMSAIETYARVQLVNNQTLAAISTYEKLAELAPKSVNVLLEIAGLQTRLGNNLDAASAYDRALAIQPTQAAALNGRVITEERLFDSTRAMELAEKFRDQLGDTRMTRLLVADAAYRAEQNEKALGLYKSAYTEEPTQRVALQVHSSLNRLGRADEGLDYLSDWLAKNEDDELVRFVLSGALIAQGDYQAAINEAEIILEKSPENAVALNNLAWLYQQIGEDEKALELAEKAYDVSPESSEVADTLGWLLYQRGETGRALELLEAASQAMPSNHEVTYHYAVVLSDTGETARAKELLERSLEDNGEFNGAEDARKLLEELTE